MSDEPETGTVKMPDGEVREVENPESEETIKRLVAEALGMDEGELTVEAVEDEDES